MYSCTSVHVYQFAIYSYIYFTMQIKKIKKKLLLQYLVDTHLALYIPNKVQIASLLLTQPTMLTTLHGINTTIQKSASVLQIVRSTSTFLLAAKTIMSASRGAATDITSKQTTPSIWNIVPMGPPDPILGIGVAFKKDPDTSKINVGIGAYRDDNGKPWVLPTVKEAQRRIVEKNLDMEYAPIEGLDSFNKAAMKLLYGEHNPLLEQKRIVCLQSLSGTGSLSVAAHFLAQYVKNKNVYVSKPTWSNHYGIFQTAGFTVSEYRYWDPNTNGLNYDGMIQDIQSFQENSIIILHACAHNPTGVDPTKEQWQGILQAIQKGNHIAIIDCAYQGFASGDPDHDAYAVRLFAEHHHPVFVCHSFAKNFGLYGQRVGSISTICKDHDEYARLDSQLKIVARRLYSSPPLHGARIVAEILNDPTLYEQWLQEVSTMANRIRSVRQALHDELKNLGSE
uniref:Aspartate aminotransferase n=4 Tax=Lygus hesperus TaxID=30085 RepID=A0A0A9YZH6_LYGHE